MLVIGAKGFAKEVLEVLHDLNELESLAFYDDVSNNVPNLLYNQFPILKSYTEAEKYFQMVDNRFAIGIGNPILRKKMAEVFEQLGGELTSVISPLAKIGHYGNKIGYGSLIMPGVIITNDIILNEGVLINLNCTIGHDCTIGSFVEMSPGTHISGNCNIGDYCVFGTNSTLLPKLTIGKNVIVAAGAVVTKDVPDNCMVAGVPAEIKKKINPIENE